MKGLISKKTQFTTFFVDDMIRDGQNYFVQKPERTKILLQEQLWMNILHIKEWISEEKKLLNESSISPFSFSCSITVASASSSTLIFAYSLDSLKSSSPRIIPVVTPLTSIRTAPWSTDITFPFTSSPTCFNDNERSYVTATGTGTGWAKSFRSEAWTNEIFAAGTTLNEHFTHYRMNIWKKKLLNQIK